MPDDLQPVFAQTELLEIRRLALRLQIHRRLEGLIAANPGRQIVDLRIQVEPKLFAALLGSQFQLQIHVAGGHSVTEERPPIREIQIGYVQVERGIANGAGAGSPRQVHRLGQAGGQQRTAILRTGQRQLVQ